MVGQKSFERTGSFVRDTLRTLRKDTQASVLPIMAAGLIPTMAMIGAGVDFGRVYLAQSKLQGAVDAGALAAVRAKQVGGTSNTQAENVGKDYIEANFPDEYLASNIAEEVVDVRDVNNVITADVTVSGTINTVLLRLVGLPSLTFSAQAQAQATEELASNVEVMMVLDNTGSMRGQRIIDLRTAATSFINTIYGDNNTREGFGIGILPYNTMVNTGRLVRDRDASMVVNRQHYTNINRSDIHSWKGCLFAAPTVQNITNDRFTMDTGAYDIRKTLPGEEGMPAFEPFVYPPVYISSFDRGNRYNVANNRRRLMAIPTIKNAMVARFGNNICRRINNNAARGCNQNNTYVAKNRLPSSEQNLYSNIAIYAGSLESTPKSGTRSLNGPSPNNQCPAEARPIDYSSTRNQLRDYITNETNALTPGTGTFHNLAMTWAYRMIERDDFFTRTRPDEDESKPVKKVVLFMTDGNFDTFDAGRWDDDEDMWKYDSTYTGYGTFEDRRVIDTIDRGKMLDHLSYRFAKTCEAMKNDGIEIYTIAFALDTGTRGDNTREMFKVCATDRNTHFFDTTNGTQLEDAFVTIASELVNLRLTR